MGIDGYFMHESFMYTIFYIVCLFAWDFRPTREFFTYIEKSPLSSEGSLACHTYSPITCNTHTYCKAFDKGPVTTCFYDLGLSRLGFEHPIFRMRGQRSNPLRHRHDKCFIIISNFQRLLYSLLILLLKHGKMQFDLR